MLNSKIDSLTVAIHTNAPLNLIRLLINKKSVNNVDSMRNSPLVYAVRRDDVIMLEILLRAGADPVRVSSRPLTALHEALLAGRNLEYITHMINSCKGIDFEAAAKANGAQPGDSLLFCAARGSNDPRVIAELIRMGGDVRLCNHDGDTPLHVALRRNCNMAFVQEFMRDHMKEIIQLSNRWKETPLCLAERTNVIRAAVVLKWALLVDQEWTQRSIPLEQLKYPATLKTLCEMFVVRLGQMHSYKLGKNLTLLDAAKAEFIKPWKEEDGLNELITDVNSLALALKFRSGSLYQDILDRVKRPLVLRCIGNARLTTWNEEFRSVTLDTATTDHVLFYLHDSDILNLVIASIFSP